MFVDPKNKDTVDGLHNAWIIEIAEMEMFKRGEANALKAFLSRGKDLVRLSYERRSKELPRPSIFVGTINPDDAGYLNDKENRRYWPVMTGKIDTDGLRKVRDQMFAEAVVKLKENPGYKLCFTDDKVMAQHASEADKRRLADPWLAVIREYLADNLSVEALTNRDILEHILCIQSGKQTRYEQCRVGRVMAQLGWEKATVDGRDKYLRPVEEIVKRKQGGAHGL